MSDFVEKIELNLDGSAVDGKAAGGLGKAADGVTKLLEQVKKLSTDTGAEAAIGSTGAALLGVVSAAAAAVAALAVFAKEAISAAAASERLENQVASFIQGSGSWNTANERSIVIVRELDQIVLRTGEDTTSLGATFRSLTTIMGGTDKQLAGMTEQLSVLGKMAGTSSKDILSIFQNAAFTGTARGPEAKELLSRFLMTPEQIRQAYLGGQLFEYLTKKIGDLKGPADALATSWDVLMQVFKSGKDQVLSDLGAGFEPLKQILIGIRDALKEGELRTAIRELATGLKQIVGAVVDVGRAAVDLVPFKEIFTAWGGLLKVVASQWILMASAAQTFITLLVAGKNIVFDFFSGKGAIEKMKADFTGALLAVGLIADKTKERLDAIWDPKSGPAAAAGKSKTPALFLDEKAIRENYKNVGDMLKKLSDEVASVGTGPEWEKAQAKIAIHIDDLQKGFDQLARQAHDLGRDLPAADIKEFNDLLVKLKGNLGAQEWQKLSDKAKEATLSMRGLAAATAEEFAALEKGQRDLDLTKMEKYAQTLPASLKKPLLAMVDNARDALERDLPAITKRGFEKAAAIAYSQAVTIGDGVKAAFLKITAELKTEGQLWADFLGGIWSGVESGLTDVLKTIETGTGSLTDALKGMLNSFLDSFNKMVVEMVKNWLFGQKQMKEGASGDDGFMGMISGLFGGATKKANLDAQGNVKLPTGWSSQQVEGGQVQGGPTSGAGLSKIVGGGAQGYGIGSLVGGISGAPGFSSGAAIGGAVVGIGLSLLSTAALASVATAIGLGAAAGSVVPILGTIIGAIIGGLIAVLTSPNTESKVWASAFAPQLKMAAENIQSGVVDVYAKSLLPDTASFASSVNKIIRGYLQKAGGFEIHAGSSEDIEKDIQRLLTGIVPAELLHQLIGQQRIGGQDVAGISGASKYGGALDPKAPINKMLTDLGFTAAKIQQLAGDIDTLAPEDWMKQLNALVGLVAGTGKLGKQVAMTYAETIAADVADAAKSPAGKLADRAAAVTDLLKAVSFYTGAAQVTKGQEAIAAAQQFYDEAKAAMLQLAAMAKQVQAEAADSITKVRDALKTPAELFAQGNADLQADYERMRFAANPEDLAAAWAKARTDFEAVAGVLVQRIQQIRAVLDDIHTLQAAMLTGPGPNAQTDPGAWLSQNLAAMDTYRAAMTAATPGSPEQIAAATSFAGLIRDRYQMEIDLLARVRSTILSINQSIDEQLFQLDLGELTGNDKAQFLYAKINDLYGQLQNAKTPEEVARLTSQIQGLTGTLLSQVGPNDPHRAEAVAFVRNILGLVRNAANTNLGGQEQAVQFDIQTLGVQLGAAEKIIAKALLKANADLEDLIWHFKRAGEFAAGQLDLWGTQIADQLNLLGPILTTMIANFTDVTTALTGGGTGTGGGGRHGPDGFIPAVQDATIAIGNFKAALEEPGAPASSAARSGSGGLSVTANVTVVNQDGEVNLEALWQELSPSLQEAFERNNVRVARRIASSS